MQAVILAAGMGKRLGALTEDNTKCMINVLGETLVERFVNQLLNIGIHRIVFVIGYQGAKLRKFLLERYACMDVEFEFVENELYDSTNNIYSLYLAKSQLVRDDTILLESDLLFDQDLLQGLVEHPKSDVVAVAKFESWMNGTVVTLESDNKIVDFINKKSFRYDDSGKYFKTVNAYKFSKEFLSGHYVPFLEAYSRSMGRNEYYEEVLRVIAFLEKCELTGYVVDPSIRWYEIDDVEDLQNAEALFSHGRDKVRRYHSRYGGYWRFPGLLDYCYLVNPFFPGPDCCNEMMWSFRSLLSQYPSGQAANALLAGKMFGIPEKWMAVGNGAAELISALFSSLEGRVGIPYPTFEEYPNRIKNGKIIPFLSRNDDFSFTADDLIEFSEEVDTLLLINPGNPTGFSLPFNDVARIVNHLGKAGKRIVIDESFLDFHRKSSETTVMKSAFLEANTHVSVVKSISKSFGVPGLRLGVLACADHKVIESLRGSLAIWNINSFAEFFMQNFEKYRKEYSHSCVELMDERDRFSGALKRIPEIAVFPSDANFILCRINGSQRADELEEYLLNVHSILIKGCGGKTGFQDLQYFRIAVRDKLDNDKFQEALLEFWRR